MPGDAFIDDFKTNGKIDIAGGTEKNHEIPRRPGPHAEI
jgi:hypothetical protein